MTRARKRELQKGQTEVVNSVWTKLQQIMFKHYHNGNHDAFVEAWGNTIKIYNLLEEKHRPDFRYIVSLLPYPLREPFVSEFLRRTEEEEAV